MSTESAKLRAPIVRRRNQKGKKIEPRFLRHPPTHRSKSRIVDPAGQTRPLCLIDITRRDTRGMDGSPRNPASSAAAFAPVASLLSTRTACHAIPRCVTRPSKRSTASTGCLFSEGFAPGEKQAAFSALQLNYCHRHEVEIESGKTDIHLIG